MREYKIMGNKGKVCWGKLYYSDKRGQFRLEFDPNIDYKKASSTCLCFRVCKESRVFNKGVFR